MGLAFKLMMFTLMFNLAAGILSVALMPYYPAGDIPMGYKYNESGNLLNKDTFNSSIDTGGADSTSFFWLSFVNFISLGFFKQIQTVVNNSIFGLSHILSSIGVLPAEYAVYFNLILSAIYVIGIIELFTGRRVTQ